MKPRRQLIYLGLKALNLVLATALSFGLVFALIRQLPSSVYTTFILVSALGVYILATDLGVSSVVFARVRKAYLDDRPQDARTTAIGAASLYGVVVLVAQLAFSAFMLTGRIPAEWRLAFGLYFLSVLLPLPWNVVRATAAGMEKFLLFESVEAARRAGMTALIFGLTQGLSFEAFAWASLALWAAAYIVVLARLLPAIGLPRGEDWNLQSVIAESRGQLGAAGVFALCEVAIYNFPYLAIPLLYSTPAALIAFDLFYKITRFGASAYLVANEGLLPAQTRAIHEGAAGRIVRNIGLGLAISAVPCLIGMAAVTLFGDLVFGLLVDDAGRVPMFVRWAMAAVLAAMLIRAASGTLLLNTGKAPLLARIAVCEAGAMSLLTAAVATSRAPFGDFLWGYVAIFAVASGAYFMLLARRAQGMFAPHAVW